VIRSNSSIWENQDLTRFKHKHVTDFNNCNIKEEIEKKKPSYRGGKERKLRRFFGAVPELACLKQQGR
jgi:hypothetical protein